MEKAQSFWNPFVFISFPVRTTEEQIPFILFCVILIVLCKFSHVMVQTSIRTGYNSQREITTVLARRQNGNWSNDKCTWTSRIGMIEEKGLANTKVFYRIFLEGRQNGPFCILQPNVNFFLNTRRKSSNELPTSSSQNAIKVGP